MKKYIGVLVVFISLFVVIPNVSSESKYYDIVWETQYEELTTYIHGINDIYESNTGTTAIGGYDTKIYTFDKEGKVLTSDELEHSNFKKFFESDDKTYAITSFYWNNGGYYVTVYEVSSEGALINAIEVPSSSYGYGVGDEIVIKEGEEYIYITYIEGEGADFYLRMDKEFKEIESIEYEDATEEDKAAMGDLYLAAINGPVLGEFKGGYITYTVELNENDGGHKYVYYYDPVDSKFTYYKNGKEEWSFDYTYFPHQTSWPTMIEMGDYILMSMYNENQEAVILLIDEEGGILEENKVDTYYESEDTFYYFKPEHIIEGKNGFYLSGWYIYTPEDETNFSEYGSSKQDTLIYFHGFIK